MKISPLSLHCSLGSDRSMKCWPQAVRDVHHRLIPGASALLNASTSSYLEVCTKPHNCMDQRPINFSFVVGTNR